MRTLHRTLLAALFVVAGVNVAAAQAVATPSAEAPVRLAKAPRQLGEAARVAAGASLAGADTATLLVGDRPIVVFRSGLGAARPAERAEAARQRIEALLQEMTNARDGEAFADSLQLRPASTGIVVAAGSRGLFVVTAADVDSLVGESIEQAATDAAAALRRALVEERGGRSLAGLVRGLILATTATFALFLLLRTIIRVRRVLQARLAGLRTAAVPNLAIGGFTLFTFAQLLTVARRLLDGVALVVGSMSAYLWLAYVLTRFVWTRAWGEALDAFLVGTLSDLALAFVGALPGLFAVVLIVIVTRSIARLVGAFFSAVESGAVQVPWAHADTAAATKRIIVALLWLFAIVVAYPYLPGSGSDVFKGVTVFAGLVLSLGSSGVISQAMSGLVLTYSRALKPGEYVRVGQVEGTVMQLGMLSTKVRTTKGEEVTIPNAVVVGAEVKNYSRLAGDGDLLLYTSVTIGYDVPWRQVDAMLRKAAERTAGINHSHDPFVLKTALSDFYVEYQLNVCISEPPRRLQVLSDLHANIVDVFNEHGVQILSPHYVADPPEPAVVPRERWFAAPAAGPGPSAAAPVELSSGASAPSRHRTFGGEPP